MVTHVSTGDPGAPAPASGPRRILVVDDNDDIRVALAHMVERLGHSAQHARDGVEAVEALATSRFDFMLLDLTMPRMTGDDVLRWLRDHPEWSRGLRVVVITAWSAGELGHLEELGADAVLPKPVRMSQIREVVVGLP